MKIWQADFYKTSLQDTQGQRLWQLLICDPEKGVVWDRQCSQSGGNAAWLVEQFQEAAAGNLPELLQVFRPQSLSILSVVAEKLGIKVEATRRVPMLKQELAKRGKPAKLELPPPQPLPEKLWGEQWRFGTIVAGDLVEMWSDRPVPFLSLPEDITPLKLGLASTVSIPGIVIYGGRRSLSLARWLDEHKPVALTYVPTVAGESGGLVLDAALDERWIVATFEDTEFAQAAAGFEQFKRQSRGLHFLLVQPDNSGMTNTGFWLLQSEIKQ
jgi:hypothetical protein